MRSYKIPSDLNSGNLDIEIALKSKDGTGLKPMPIKVILSYVVAIIAAFYILSHTFIGQGETWQIGFFLISYGLLIYQLTKFDKTKRMQVELIPVLFSYLPKAMRNVIVRKNEKANAFWGIAGIESIDENGLVKYIDNSYGYWYRVVGSASILLFDTDRDAILDRVDSFYRKIGVDGEIIFMTSKESQKVYRQVSFLQKQYENLDVEDPDLDALCQEKFHVLKDYVGGEFRSIHQYMVLKGDNKEALYSLKNVVQSEYENSANMLKQCVLLYEADITEALHGIYAGDAGKD